MKTFFVATLSAAALALAGAPQAVGQTPVSTGIVQGVAPTAGALTIRSNQNNRPVTFYGMDRATYQTATGQPAVIGDVQPGMLVTVHYSVRGGKWFIDKVLLPTSTSVTAPVPFPPSMPVNLDPALRTPAATDGDITTQPGAKAAVDGDITTQPAGNPAADRDITTQPGSKAATDRDITTQPGNKAAIDNDITTKPATNPATDRDITTQPGSKAGLRRTAP